MTQKIAIFGLLIISFSASAQSDQTKLAPETGACYVWPDTRNALARIRNYPFGKNPAVSATDCLTLTKELNFDELAISKLQTDDIELELRTTPENAAQLLNKVQKSFDPKDYDIAILVTNKKPLKK